jgi:hypothetical protein
MKRTISDYKFTGDHTDVDELTQLGYRDDVRDVDCPIYVEPDMNSFCAIKTFPDNVAVTIENPSKVITVYKFEGLPDHHTVVDLVLDEAPYVQELVDCLLATKKEGDKSDAVE